MTEMTNGKNALSVDNRTEAENIRDAAKEDTGSQKFLKFRKGEYFANGEPVPLGTEYLVHATSWLKCWTKFVDKKPVDRKLFRVAKGEKPINRDDLDEPEKAGTDNDPWTLQSLLPFENLSTNEVFIFATNTKGGRQAVADCCDAYAARILNGRTGQPIVQLAVGETSSKDYGRHPKPVFRIVRWDDGGAEDSHEIVLPPSQKVAAKRDDMDDEIPF